MRIVETEGRTKAEAVKSALKELGADIKDVKVECLDAGKTGFLGLGQSRPARVRVYLTAENGPVAVSSGSSEVTEFIEKTCSLMGVVCRTAITADTEDQVVIRLDTKDSAFLIGHRGKTLESLQYIVNVIFNGGKDKQKKILLDIENYREKRRASLEKLARNIAQKVRRTRQACVLEEMNPYERRIIHVTLERERDIETVSIGPESGSMKKVKIMLKPGSGKTAKDHEDGTDG